MQMSLPDPERTTPSHIPRKALWKSRMLLRLKKYRKNMSRGIITAIT
jgi:hypothetical protein